MYCITAHTCYHDEMMNRHVLALTLRVFLGVLFFFQGYDKIFKLKIKGVFDTYHDETQQQHIPNAFLWISVYYTSFAELLGGALLIIGLFINISLYVLCIDLVMAAVAFGSIKPVWDMRHVFPRLVLLAALLLMPHHWHYYSLDRLLF